MTSETCGAACCAVEICSKFVFVAQGKKQPMIEGACPGKKICDGKGGCCFLKGEALPGGKLKIVAGAYVAGSVVTDTAPAGPKTEGISMGVTENKYNHGL